MSGTIDYPKYVIRALIQYEEELEQIKTRPMRTIQPDSFTGPHKDTTRFTESAPEVTAFRGARIPYNSNRRTEMLSDMTCDLERAIKHAGLTEFEHVSLLAKFTFEEYDVEMSDEANAAFEDAITKLYDFLNFGYTA